MFLIIIILFPQASIAWWNTSWEYRKPINITNPGNNLINYPIKLTIDSKKLISDNRLNPDGSDIRFIGADDATLLAYWNETPFNETRTIIWVNVTSLPSGNTTIYMYYGNPSASDASNPEAVFSLFDDFTGTLGSAPDSNKWNIAKKGSVNAVAELDGSGNLHLAGESGVTSSGNVRSIQNFTNNFAIRLKHKITDGHYSDVSIGNGTIQDADSGGQSSWWHTTLGNGYHFNWQNPVTYGYINDYGINYIPEGSASSALSAVDADTHMTNANEWLTFEYIYTSSGKLKYLGSDKEEMITTPTHDGSGQATHPDVLYFPQTWNGYKYWMVMTPYYHNNDIYEHPNLLASNDGITWEVPPNVTNPIIDSGGSFDADPDMVYVNQSYGVRLYWRYGDELRISHSNNSVNWSTPIIAGGIEQYGNLVSPAVVKNNDTDYDMWLVNITTSPYQIVYKNSTDGIFFNETPTSIVTLENAPANKEPWHIDVVKNGSEYIALILFQQQGQGANGLNAELYIANSTNKLTFTVQNSPILSPVSETWTKTGIYRSTGIYDSANNKWKIWFSGLGLYQTNVYSWHIGYTEFKIDSSGNWIRQRNPRPHLWTNATNTTFLNSQKSILLSQGEYSAGYGGDRYIDWVFVRQYREPEPIPALGTEETDTEPPIFSNNNANTTKAGKPVNFSVIISDNTELSGYIFSTNNTGVWVNYTWTPLANGGTAQNITILNSTVGLVVNYSFYANDSFNNWAYGTWSITTTYPPKEYIKNASEKLLVEETNKQNNILFRLYADKLSIQQKQENRRNFIRTNLMLLNIFAMKNNILNLFRFGQDYIYMLSTESKLNQIYSHVSNAVILYGKQIKQRFVAARANVNLQIYNLISRTLNIFRNISDILSMFANAKTPAQNTQTAGGNTYASGIISRTRHVFRFISDIININSDAGKIEKHKTTEHTTPPFIKPVERTKKLTESLERDIRNLVQTISEIEILFRKFFVLLPYFIFLLF